MSNKTALELSILAAAVLATGIAACIIPDRDIVVINEYPCGEEWTVSAVGAYGYNIHGATYDITNDRDRWLAKTYCLSAAQGAQLSDPTSELYFELTDDIVALCQARAVELSIADLDDSCSSSTEVGYIGHCYKEGIDCDADSETDEGDSDTGDAPPIDGEDLVYADLDLDAEVRLVAGEYLISQRLIDTALADPVGVSNDGTTPIQVSDQSGAPHGFEITGVAPGNLGHALGLQDGDIVIAVASQPTATYKDLLELVGVLLRAERTTIVLERRGELIERELRRVPWP